ncbi:MAG: alpha-acetolactate decarboxylase, partial [Rhodospirillaceae bacterium]|nr:alpha-acetolactate decarboxylase [Rhodospirillaceae bacterium]
MTSRLRALAATLLMIAVSPAIAHDTDVIVQFSTLDALKAGLYDGTMTYGEMAEYGDFGVGTFNAIDGEMVGFDGRFWQIREDGSVTEIAPDTETPFAVMTFFDRDVVFALPEGADFGALSELLSEKLASANT